MSGAAGAGELAGKVAIVTGASKGIGKAVAELFVSCGASVLLMARSVEPLQALALELRSQGAAVGVFAGDAAAPGAAAAAVEAALGAFGRVDILANIAGVYPTARLNDITDEMFAQTVNTNFTATFAMCRAVMPVMERQQGGAIVNISSTAARLPTPGLSVYGATKAAVEAFTRAIAAEAAPVIRVNAVSAGPTWTDTVRDLMSFDATGAVETVTKSIPLARLASPREIAEAVLFLASDRASFVTGQVLHANGGGFMA